MRLPAQPWPSHALPSLFRARTAILALRKMQALHPQVQSPVPNLQPIDRSSLRKTTRMLYSGHAKPLRRDEEILSYAPRPVPDTQASRVQRQERLQQTFPDHVRTSRSARDVLQANRALRFDSDNREHSRGRPSKTKSCLALNNR